MTTRRIRIDASTVLVSGILRPEIGGVPAAIELDVTGEVSVRTMIPQGIDTAAPDDPDDGLDLPFLISQTTTTQLEADALAVVWSYVIAALHDHELVKLTRQHVLTDHRKNDAERSIVRALRAKSVQFSRPEFSALKVRVANAARNVEELAKAVGAQVDAIDQASDGQVDESAKGAARTASDALAALVREMDALEHAASSVKGKTGGAPRKAWRDDLMTGLVCSLSLDGEIMDRIAEAAIRAVDAINLGSPETISMARKNLGEKS